MDTFPCKFEEKKSGLRTHGGSNNSVLQTPGKMKSKKKTQASSMSLDSSGGNGLNSNDKKESSTTAKAESLMQ